MTDNKLIAALLTVAACSNAEPKFTTDGVVAEYNQILESLEQEDERARQAARAKESIRI